MLDQIQPIACLQSEHPFVAVLDSDDDRRASAVESMVRTVSNPRTLVIRLENRRKVPFTPERLRQTLAEARGRAGPPGRRDIRHLCHPTEGQTRIVLIIEQAETLVPASLLALQAAALEGERYFLPLQVVFAGTPAFLSRLRRPELSVMRYTLDDDAEDIDHADADSDSPEPGRLHQTMPPGRAAYLPPSRTAPQATMWLASALSLAVLASLAAWRLSPNEAPASVSLAAARPAATATMISALAPATHPAPTVAPVETAVVVPAPPAQDTQVATPVPAAPEAVAPDVILPVAAAVPTPEQRAARLRAEFDAFLVRSGQVPGLTETRRQALFDDFQQWRAKQPPRRPAETVATKAR